MANVSKNARTGSRVDTLNCKCGGVIKMKSMFMSGKIRHYAECDKCLKTSRRPKDLM